MAAEAPRRGAGHTRQLAILGDGAAWIWNLAARHFPAATQIVDLYHAREHLHELARVMEFMLGTRYATGPPPARRARPRRHRRDLAAARAVPLASPQGPRPGQRPGLLRTQRPPHALRPLQRSRPVHRLRRSRSRLDRQSSGSAWKLSGMRWTRAGATGILTLRCLQASNRWEEILHPARPGDTSPA